MNSVDRAVDALPLVVDITLEEPQQTVPFSILGPAIETIENRFPRPKFAWQVPPRHPSPVPPQHRADEAPIIFPGPTSASIAIKEHLNLRPLAVIQCKPQCHQ